MQNISTYCITNQIDSFSTIKLEGSTSLTSYTRIKTMFRHAFKLTDIFVKIYTEQQITEEEKQRIMYEHHNSPSRGHAGVTRTIKRLKLNHSWRHLKRDVKRYI